jgi:hypothetical protein
MMKRMKRIVLVFVLACLAAPSGAALAQELEVETDARLEGYPEKMGMVDPGNTAMTWAAFGFCAAVAILGLFKDAKRTHLD